MVARPKTFTLTKEQAERDAQWLVVDAAGVPLGRLASQVAALLRGKHKPTFTTHIDSGDYVIVVNADKVSLSGRKLDQKKYFKHSGYVGGISSIVADDLRDRNPERMIQLAVKRMIPKGALGHQVIKKLKVYAGDSHPHAAQKPEVFELKNGASTKSGAQQAA